MPPLSYFDGKEIEPIQLSLALEFGTDLLSSQYREQN
jgi:hypothetical protein